MNQRESEVEKLARFARKGGKVMLYVWVGCGGLVVVVGLLLLALAILLPTCILG